MDHRGFFALRPAIIKTSRARHPLVRGDTLAPPSQPVGVRRSILPHWVTRSAPGRLDSADDKESPRRTEMMLDEMTLENIPNATTLSLMRARARDLSATYTRLVRIKYPNDGHLFAWRSPERGGDDSARFRVLSKYIGERIEEIARVKADVMENKEWRKRYKLASRSSGVLVKQMRVIHQAIVSELAKRKRDDTECDYGGAKAHCQPPAQAVGISESTGYNGPLFPEQYREDVERIDREMRADDLGIRKPTANERRVAARTNAYGRGDFESVANHDKDIHWHLTVKRTARHRRKIRKQGLRCYIGRRGYNSTPDPRSDDEGGSPIA